MDASGGQKILDWTQPTSEQHESQQQQMETMVQSQSQTPYMTHILSSISANGPVEDGRGQRTGFGASQSPIYPSPSQIHGPEAPSSNPSDGRYYLPGLTLSHTRILQPDPEQPFYGIITDWNPSLQEQTQSSTPGPLQYPQESFTPLQYACPRPGLHRRPFPSSSGTQIVMRKRRDPYPVPNASQGLSKVFRVRPDPMTGHEVGGRSMQPQRVQTCPPPKQETRYQDALEHQQPPSLDAPTSVPVKDASSLEHGLPLGPASSHSPSSEGATFNQGTIWRDRRLNPEPSAGTAPSPSSSQPPPLSAMPTPATKTVFIHSNLARDSDTSHDAVEDYEEYKSFFPESTERHRQLRIAMHEVMTSEWKLRNELEPTSRDLLQFSSKVFGKDGVTTFKCLMWHGKSEECDKTWNRAERILAHLRGSIDLRPFACEGSEADDACNCGTRFFAEDTLQQHKKNCKTIACDYCGAGITPRNKKRHVRHNCPKSPERP